ncbi:hypothetical protein CFC21_034895 [Triticum aestivum]|uniref:Uncharacterized protein n=3 Tax=Triticum TaxID=4564 RepID=A0A9R0VH75_TRITD|nr:uncharacterized protein LOC119267752 [Triticum dicoccoides]XP_044339666.1 uncharacterized protein LOC123060867 [Triticum aestivum]KAF7022050.1 hypothetical protein CFC21_034895 [Triticum aestivum]VAH59513.1 unnamed protein product [Triticum turgidum subsp. durum]
MSSFLSAPRDADVVRQGRKKADEPAERAPALDLLDDYWFFSNSLGGSGGGRDDAAKGRTRPPLLPKSPSTSSGRTAKAQGSRRLLRTPSLPAPRIGMDPSSPKDNELIVEEDAGCGGDQQEAEVEDDDMNWSKIYEGVLRTRIAEEGRGSSALNRAPSMPVTSSATIGDGHGRRPAGVAESTPSMPRLRHSHSTLERHYRSHTPTKPDRTPRMIGGGSRAERGPPRRDLRSLSANQQPALVRDKSSLQDKMWKSSSALESIEVQGFKDLGFVFDQEELRESLADVLPGLRDDKANKPHKSSGSVSGSSSTSDNDDSTVNNANGIGIGASNSNAAGNDDGDGVVRRPYLSEAWQHGARSAPPTAAAAIRLQQADARSAAEMKDQIRMWAQAVACNVRQEC